MAERPGSAGSAGSQDAAGAVAAALSDDEAGGGAPSPGVATVRVVIADDHGLLRAGTRQILEAAGGIEVVGEADDGDSALACCARVAPDVLLLDIRMPGTGGMEVARRMAAEQPGTRVVILSAYDDQDYVRAALAAGVAGYLLKTMPGDELVRAVRAAAAGTTVLDPSVTRQLAAPSPPEPAETALTWREREVVALVADGLANKVIAHRLGISARTVEGHLNHVFAKLGLVSRTELVRYAIDHRLTAADAVAAPPGPP